MLSYGQLLFSQIFESFGDFCAIFCALNLLMRAQSPFQQNVMIAPMRTLTFHVNDIAQFETLLPQLRAVTVLVLIKLTKFAVALRFL